MVVVVAVVVAVMLAVMLAAMVVVMVVAMVVVVDCWGYNDNWGDVVLDADSMVELTCRNPEFVSRVVKWTMRRG